MYEISLHEMYTNFPNHIKRTKQILQNLAKRKKGWTFHNQLSGFVQKIEADQIGDQETSNMNTIFNNSNILDRDSNDFTKILVIWG